MNLKPIVPGHVLVIPKRICPRFSDLTEDEVSDIFLSVHKIAPRLELHYKCSALNIAMQDGADAGNVLLNVSVYSIAQPIISADRLRVFT